MLITDAGEVQIGKVLTTPSDPSRGVEEVLATALDQMGRSGGEVRHIVHGTTLVTNAIIERKGARTALITSAGFRDSIEIGREHRYELYDLMIDLPKPLVPRHLRFAIPERTLADGTVATELDEAHLAQLARELVDAGVEAVAICFLHSFTNPEPEKRAREVIANVASGLRVSISSEVVPEIREFERASTTIANVYTQPLVEQYLAELVTRMKRLGVNGQLFVMLSSGGVATLNTSIRFPIRLVESGPAAGAIAAAEIGTAIGRDSLLSFDMGGTTAKLSVVEGGTPLVTHDFEVDRRYRFKKGSGLPVKVPVIEMIEIGAGGGSIARVDSLGLLKVGPDSSGAEPGPACYARGGTLPTVTDADLVLGYLDPDYFLGGAMRLDVDQAAAAIEKHVCAKMNVSLDEAAWGIHQVVNENMANAARVHVIERGKNPRVLPTIAFGGAGPAHGFGVAELMGSPELVLPYGAGVVSALGLLSAPLAFDFVRSHHGQLDSLDWQAINNLFADMELQGTEMLQSSVASPDEITHVRTGDIRYIGQGHEIRVPIPPGVIGASDRDTIYGEFDKLYRQLYGRAGPPVGLEALTWRVVSSGPRPQITMRHPGTKTKNANQALKGERMAYFSGFGGYVPTPVYERSDLHPGTTFAGPAIIEERESTGVIGEGGHVSVDSGLNIIVTLRQAAKP